MQLYDNQMLVADNQPVIKTMPIDLKEIKKHQLESKSVQKLLGTDKRFHIKIFLGQDSQNLMDPLLTYCVTVIRL